MFEYQQLPYMEEEARASIWAALCEITMLELERRTLGGNTCGENEYNEQRLADIEHRQSVVEKALWEYSSQHWLSRGEYLEWHAQTIGGINRDLMYYCFES